MGNIAGNMADESRPWKINRSRVSYPFCEWERRLALIQIYCHLRAGARRSNTGIMLTQARGIYTKLEVICRGRAQTPSTTAVAVSTPLPIGRYHPASTLHRAGLVCGRVSRNSPVTTCSKDVTLSSKSYLCLEICSRIGRFLIYEVDR